MALQNTRRKTGQPPPPAPQQRAVAAYGSRAYTPAELEANAQMVNGDYRAFDDPDDKQLRKRSQQQGRCCVGCDSNTSLLLGIFIMNTIFALGMIVVIASIYGPYGKISQTMNTAEIWVQKINGSGVMDIIYTAGQTWQATNQTAAIFDMMSGAQAATDIAFGVIQAIEPELVGELMNKTSITVTNLLTIIDGLITQKGLNINIPLGAFNANRRLL